MPVATVCVPSVQIGGLAAQVTYSGLAVDLAGLYQVTAVLPTRCPPATIRSWSQSKGLPATSRYCPSAWARTSGGPATRGLPGVRGHAPSGSARHQQRSRTSRLHPRPGLGPLPERTPRGTHPRHPCCPRLAPGNSARGRRGRPRPARRVSLRPRRRVTRAAQSGTPRRHARMQDLVGDDVGSAPRDLPDFWPVLVHVVDDRNVGRRASSATRRPPSGQRPSIRTALARATASSGIQSASAGIPSPRKGNR